MSGIGVISMEEAKKQFIIIMSSLSSPNRETFLNHVHKHWMAANISCDSSFSEMNSTKHDVDEDELDEDALDDPVQTLNAIAEDIKQRVSFDASFPSEKILPPKRGENSDCDPKITLHVDEFLHTDDDVDELVELGKLQRHYCKDCGSKNIENLIYISHSMSRDCLYHIFDTLLPTLQGKTILDVGSRLGAVLYGAYVYTDATRIIGVEMNEEFCELQREIVRKYKMQDRVEIVNKRVEDAVDLVATADVVILNNVFEFYMPEAQQIEIWQFLRANIKKGATIVTRPRIETTFEHLGTGICTETWLKHLVQTPRIQHSGFFNVDNDEADDKYKDIACYQVL